MAQEPKHKAELGELSTLLCLPVQTVMPWQTALALVSTQSIMQHHGLRFEIAIQPGNSLVHVARNHLANRFLASGHNRLVWIDSDLTWHYDDFLRLLAQSTFMECVSAAYVSKDDRGGALEFQFSSALAETEPNEWGCHPHKGMGLGFTCVTRRVMEEVARINPSSKISPTTWEHRIFRDDISDGWFDRGEDMAFFNDVMAIGVQPYVDPKIDLGHIGMKVYRGSLQKYIDQHKKGGPANGA